MQNVTSNELRENFYQPNRPLTSLIKALDFSENFQSEHNDTLSTETNSHSTSSIAPLSFNEKILSPERIQKLAEKYSDNFSLDIGRMFEPNLEINSLSASQMSVSNSHSNYNNFYPNLRDNPKALREKFEKHMACVLNGIQETAFEETDLNANRNPNVEFFINAIIALMNSESLPSIFIMNASAQIESTFDIVTNEPAQLIRVRKKHENSLVLTMTSLCYKIRKKDSFNKEGEPIYFEAASNNEPSVVILHEVEISLINQNIHWELTKNEMFIAKFINVELYSSMLNAAKTSLTNNDNLIAPSIVNFFPVLQLTQNEENENILTLSDLNVPTHSYPLLHTLIFCSLINIDHLVLTNVKLGSGDNFSLMLLSIIKKVQLKTIHIIESDIQSIINNLECEKLIVENSKELNLKNNAQIKQLKILNNRSTQLEISNTTLERLEIEGCPLLFKVTLTHSPQIKIVTIKNCKAFESMHCPYNLKLRFSLNTLEINGLYLDELNGNQIQELIQEIRANNVKKIYCTGGRVPAIKLKTLLIDQINELDLSVSSKEEENQINKKNITAAVLDFILHPNCNVKKISLTNLKIPNQEITKIIKILSIRNIEYVDLSHNELTSTHVKQLIQISTMKKLSLIGLPQLNDNEKSEILKELKNTTRITFLNLGEENVDIQEIKEQIKLNRNLSSFSSITPSAPSNSNLNQTEEPEQESARAPFFPRPH